MSRVKAPAFSPWAETLQGVAVQVQTVTPGEPYDEVAIVVDAKPQRAAPGCQLFDPDDEFAVVAVAFTAALAAAFESFSGIEGQVQFGSAPAKSFDPTGGDEAVEVFEGAEFLISVTYPGQAMLTRIGGARRRLGGFAAWLRVRCQSSVLR